LDHRAPAHVLPGALVCDADSGQATMCPPPRAFLYRIGRNVNSKDVLFYASQGPIRISV